MDFQAYNKILICKGNIRNTFVDGLKTGYEFDIKYPSYRGAFLSCIEALTFKIDGIEIPKEDIQLQVNNKLFLMDELSECFKEYWFVRDKGTVKVFRDGGLEAGVHELNVYMKHRVPYTGYFGQYLVLESDVTEKKIAD